MTSSIAARLVAVLLVAVPLTVGLFFPSQHLAADGLDELMVVEAPDLRINPKHPAAEATLWLGFRALRAGGYEGRAIRPVQLWNAVWLTVALAGLLVATQAWLSSKRLACFACLPFLHVSLRWAADPFLAYWPPALAALSWALVLARRPSSPASFLGLATVLVVMVFVNPILCLALPAVALAVADRLQGQTRISLLRPWLLLALPPVLLVSFLGVLGRGHSPAASFGATAGIFGVWTTRTLPQGLAALRDLFFPSRAELVAFSPHFGAVIATGCTALLLVATGVLFASLLPLAKRSRAWPVLLALPSLVVILWWAPRQVFFYLLPIWLLFALWPTAPREDAGQTPVGASWTKFLSLVPAIVLALVNGVAYLGKVQSEDPRRAWVVACAARFHPADRLYFPLFGDPTFAYFGGIETSSLLEPFRSRRPGQSTFDATRELLEQRKLVGGTLYFRVPPTDQDWVPAYVRERASLDYDNESILARFVWGEEVTCDPIRFRRLVAVR